MGKHKIANWKLLQENYKVDDLLDLSQKEEHLWNQISKIQGPSFIFITAPAGTGKSTFIYNMLKKRLAKKQYFIFEGWRYSNRKILWYAFIEEYYSFLFPNKTRFRKILKKSLKSQKLIKSAINLSLPAAIITKFLSPLIFALMDAINDLFLSTPSPEIIKAYEDQFFRILKGNKSIKKKIHIIVLDDIDRCGEEGLIFLEAIYRATKELSLNYNLKVILPITNAFYKSHQYNLQKMQDYRFKFLLEDTDWTNFFQKILNIDEFKLFNHERQKQCNINYRTRKLFIDELNQITQILIKAFKSQFTIRKLKAIIREAIIQYETLTDNLKDFRIIYILTATKYFKKDINDNLPIANTFKNSIIQPSYSFPENIIRKLLFQIAFSSCQHFMTINEISDYLKEHNDLNKSRIEYSRFDVPIKINYALPTKQIPTNITTQEFLKKYKKPISIQLNSEYQQIFLT